MRPPRDPPPWTASWLPRGSAGCESAPGSRSPGRRPLAPPHPPPTSGSAGETWPESHTRVLLFPCDFRGCQTPCQGNPPEDPNSNHGRPPSLWAAGQRLTGGQCTVTIFTVTPLARAPVSAPGCVKAEPRGGRVGCGTGVLPASPQLSRQSRLPARGAPLSCHRLRRSDTEPRDWRGPAPRLRGPARLTRLLCCAVTGPSSLSSVLPAPETSASVLSLTHRRTSPRLRPTVSVTETHSQVSGVSRSRTVLEARL